MKTIDWQYDFSTLPCWDNRDKILCVTDEYIESPHASYLCALYSNCEVSMMNYMGFLAMLENKAAPKLMLNVTAFNITDEKAFFTSNERYLILQAHLRQRHPHGYIDAFCIIDLKESTFAFVHNPWTHTRAFEEIIEVDQNTVVIHPHNITVELGKLLYESLDKINDVKTVKFEKKLFGKGRLIPIFD